MNSWDILDIASGIQERKTWNGTKKKYRRQAATEAHGSTRIPRIQVLSQKTAMVPHRMVPPSYKS